MTRRLCSIFFAAIGCALACLAVLSGQTRPPGQVEVKLCSADKPLGGRIEITSEWLENGCRGSKHALLHFPLVNRYYPKMPAKWPPFAGAQYWTSFDAPEVTYELSTGGCSGATINGEETCHASAEHKSGKVILGDIGPFGFRGNRQDGSLSFDPVRPNLQALVLLTKENGRASTLLECVGRNGGGGRGTWLFGYQGLGINPAGPACEPATAESLYYQNPFAVCLPPNDCSYPRDEAARQECIVHADRHAIIPFVGEEKWTAPRAPIAGYGILSYKISWQIGCGCENGPCGERSSGPTPLPTATPDPCGSTAPQDALWHLCVDQENAIAAELGKLIQTQKEEAKEANSHFEDFKRVADDCKKWENLKEVLELLIGGETFAADLGPEAAAEFKEFKEAISLLMEMGGKAADGENPWTAMAPEEIKDVMEKREKLNNFIAKLDILLNGYTPESAGKILEDCSAPIPEDVFKSAEQYVEHLKASLESLKEISKRLNDLRSKGEECLKKQWDAYKACVEHARCEKTPESACADKKPPGNWVDVP